MAGPPIAVRSQAAGDSGRCWPVFHAQRNHALNAYNLDPKPRDLADAAFQAKRTDEDFAAVIRSGGGAAGLSTGMPPWGRTLSERKVRNVVDFLRTFPQK